MSLEEFAKELRKDVVGRLRSKYPALGLEVEDEPEH